MVMPRGDVHYDADRALLNRKIRDMKEALGKLKGPLARVTSKIQADNPTDSRRKLVTKIVNSIETRPKVISFLDKHIGDSSFDPKMDDFRDKALRGIASVLLAGGDPQKENRAVEYLSDTLTESFTLQILKPAQSNIRNVMPEDIKDLLPPNIVVDIDPDGRLKDITERMGNKFETMREKVSEMKVLIARYNNVVREIKGDMNDPSSFTRTMAVMAAIIMETGIRPGRPGNKSKDWKATKEQGKDVHIETFGATTLRLDHFVGVLKEDFIQIEFAGKRAIKNTAVISDRDVAKIVMAYVKKGQAEITGNPSSGDLPVFRQDNGNLVSYYDLSHYLRMKLGGLKTRDFRRLKATREFFYKIRATQQAMYDAIKRAVDAKVSNLRSVVSAEVVKVVEEAYSASRDALSHSTENPAIYAYINTEVVLSFLEEGHLDDTFENIILKGGKKVVFDPKKFMDVASARGKTAGELIHSLEGVIAGLEAEMAELDELLGFEKF